MKPNRRSIAVGRALANNRARLGLTQDELAKLSRLAQNHISKLERGERLPAWSTMRALARVLPDKAVRELLLAS